MLSVVWQQARHQPRRLLACGLAVMLGVAFVVTVLGTTATLKRTMSTAAASQVAGADVVVTAGEDTGELTPAQVRAATSVPGVAVAESRTVGTTSATWPDGPDLVTLATAPGSAQFRGLDLTAGRWPLRRGEAVLDSKTASKLSLGPGASVPLVDRGVDARVVGIVELGLGSGLSGRVLMAPDADVQAWSGAAPGAVVLRAATGSPAALRATVARAVDSVSGPVSSTAAGEGARPSIRTGADEADARARRLTGDLDILGALLLGFAGVALVVAMIVIANTFAILIAQRGRELALLRCVGATRGQVMRTVLGEAVVVGVVSSVLGLAAGASVTWGATVWVGHEWPVSDPHLSLPVSGLVAALLVGVGTTLVAALLPARRGSRIAPLAALRPATAPAARRAGIVRSVAGLVVAGAGTAALVASSRKGIEALPLGMLGGALALGGVLLAGAMLVPALVRLLGPAFSRRPTGTLAVANTLRNPGRAASTVTALLVGICLITMMLVGAASVRKAADDSLDAYMPVDAALALDASSATGLPESATTALAGLPGTAATALLRTVGVRAESADPQPMIAFGADSAALARVMRTGRVPQPGEIVVDPGTARSNGWRDGGTARVRVGLPGATSGLRTATVRVVVSKMTPATLLAGVDVQEWVPQARTTSAWVRVADGTDGDDYLHRLRRLTDEVNGAGTEVAGMAGTIEQRAMMDQVLMVLLWVVTGLLGVALLIAVVGVANTLSLSVVERTRESGVQRALGMTRGQLRAGLAIEAVVLAVVASALGIALGVVFGWAGSLTLLSSEVDPVVLVVPWGRLALVAAGAVAAAVAASVLPARRAARVAPTVALAAD